MGQRILPLLRHLVQDAHNISIGEHDPLVDFLLLKRCADEPQDQEPVFLASTHRVLYILLDALFQGEAFRHE